MSFAGVIGVNYKFAKVTAGAATVYELIQQLA
jgi:hypothetical protein